ncbi:hypothetical protein EYC80_003390 [Monilinia laxa]|uniref:Uncharacterized protein n=1 Tax=Monilinia laxa TaxID=61186 RepID=A0A5N6KDX7_MONLA|nr:hypothetical protein EYC80_003390 [Monilinia laxa]
MFNNSEGGNLSEDDVNLSLPGPGPGPGPGPINSAEEVPTAGHTKSSSGKMSEDPYSLNGMNTGSHKCHYIYCDKEFPTKQGLRNHPETATLYKNRVSETRLNRKAPRMRQKEAGSMIFPEAGRNHCKEENDEDDEDKDKDEEEEDYDEERSQKKSFNYPEIRHISRGWECPAKGCKAYRKFKYNLHSHWQDKHPNLPVPSDIASMISTVSDQSTEQHPASFLDDSHLVGAKMEDFKEDYGFDNDGLPFIDVGSEQSPDSGTLASTHQPVHHQPSQIHSRQPVPNNTDSQRPSTRFKREVDDNSPRNYMITGNIQNFNAKATPSTPSVASSRSPMIAAVQARTSTNTVHPYNPSVTLQHQGAPTMHPSTAALVDSSGKSSKPSKNHLTGPTGNSSIFATSHPANNSLTKTTAPATHLAANRSAPKGPFPRPTEAHHFNPPPPARSNQASRSTVILTNTKPSRNQVTKPLMATGTSLSSGNRTTPNNVTKSQARTRPRTSFRSSPLNADNEDEEDEDEDDDYDDDDDEEESLFVSPTDNGKMQRGEDARSNTRVLGVRGFANMPLPRDQDSDEEDLRPSHILRQERRAAAGRSPYYPPGARDPPGRLYGTNGPKRTMGMGSTSGAKDIPSAGSMAVRKTATKAAADQFDDDSHDDDEFDNSLENTSSDDSFQESLTRSRRPTTRNNTSPPTTKPHRPTTKPTDRQRHPDPPRTPSPTNPTTNPKYIPYQTYLPDLTSPPPSRLIKSPNVTNRQLPYPNRPSNAYLSDIGVVQPSDLFDADDIFFTFQGPTARETELQKQFDQEKLQLRLNALGSGFRPPMHFDTCPHTAPISRLERVAWIQERVRLDEWERSADGDGFVGGAAEREPLDGTDGAAGLQSRRKATCAGPARVKRKYTWKDGEMKNKRARRSKGVGDGDARMATDTGADAIPVLAGGDDPATALASMHDDQFSGSPRRVSF